MNIYEFLNVEKLMDTPTKQRLHTYILCVVRVCGYVCVFRMCGH